MRIAMLGVSHWHAGFHAQAACEAGAELVSVWDADPACAGAFAARHGGTAVREVAAALETRPELVVALGRAPATAELVAELLAHDVPLLVDKPLGLTARDVAPLVDAAAAGGRFVSVALANRVAPMLEEAERLRAGGKLGAVSQMLFRINNGPPHRYRDWGVGWMLDPGQSGGGALRNLGLHGLDAFAALAGDQPVRVEHASFGRGVHGEALEDYALVVLRAADGMLGVVEAGYTHADPRAGNFVWRIDAAQASLGDEGPTLIVSTPDGPPANLPGVPVGRRYAAFMADTLARIREGRPPLVSLTDFHRAMALADEAYAMGRR